MEKLKIFDSITNITVNATLGAINLSSVTTSTATSDFLKFKDSKTNIKVSNGIVQVEAG